MRIPRPYLIGVVFSLGICLTAGCGSAEGPTAPEGGQDDGPPAAKRWVGRASHTSILFDTKLWVMGGLTDTRLSDVWYSSDGANWTQASSGAWVGRQGHTSLAFDGRIWVMGGRDNGEVRLNDVWYSTDGVSWTQATSSAAWPPRSGHTAVVFDTKMWVIGGRRTTGFDAAAHLNDVWYSTDGVSWTEATSAAPWKQRHDHTSIVFDDKIWVIGGQIGLIAAPTNEIFSDVWQSTDGVSWTEAASSASWGPKQFHTSVVYDARMWVLGGRNAAGHHNDVSYSSDGVTWTAATSSAQWEVRQGHTSLVFDSKMWVIGGISLQERLNDVWHSADGETWIDARSP